MCQKFPKYKDFNIFRVFFLSYSCQEMSGVAGIVRGCQELLELLGAVRRCQELVQNVSC